ncbi:hypothetical protein SAMD00019534_055570 [Acytostelium subglobosum LB1]|uniref:hypothetical protein n=1 Tax=Acytostelium subglobosum LB1 TaxID=1410327 RepID=UPI0006448B24|nr:hypothetical protein SAMD00019534_055570 [Acytostelium subglobosum LB1]GAM22382.1 hypothetical protein SAMD00019534_055570 [Acytostelium subglobosum LB1]|eukprot:XP_012754502.1 hypothetical protein SAMD00019534_055570 [Acytostelium subglobosum LB1]
MDTNNNNNNNNNNTSITTSTTTTMTTTTTTGGGSSLVDENFRKVFDYGRSMLTDLARIDDMINASDVVSELEIVMFSRRMTSRCSELSTPTPGLAHSPASQIDLADTSFGIARQYSHNQQFNIIKCIIVNITNIINGMKTYNGVARKGSSLSSLIPLKKEYHEQRKQLIQHWKELIIYVSEVMWRVPRIYTPKSTSGSSSPLHPLTPSSSLLSIPASPISELAITSPVIVAASPSPCLSPSPSPSPSPSLLPSNWPHQLVTTSLPTSPRKMTGGRGMPLPINNNNSNTVTQQQQQQPQATLFDVLHQIRQSLSNLLWHLKNYQRIQMNKQQQQQQHQQQPHQMPKLSESPVGAGDSAINQHHHSHLNESSPQGGSPRPLGTIYIETTRSLTLPTLCLQLQETTQQLNIKMESTLFITLINGLAVQSHSEMIESLTKCIDNFKSLVFSVNINVKGISNHSIKAIEYTNLNIIYIYDFDYYYDIFKYKANSKECFVTN